MKIGILMCGAFPQNLQELTGDFDVMFQSLLGGQEFTFETYSVFENQFPASVQDCDGWLISGSKFGVYDGHAWIAALEDFVREAIQVARPVVGICFGHQLVAQALGGTVEKFKGGWAIGRKIYEFGGVELPLNAWHQDQVTEIPAEAKVIGRSAFCENAMLAYGDTAFSVQAHPEYSHEFIKGLADTRGRGLVPDALLEQLEANLDLPLDQVMFAERIGQFFKTAQTKGRAA